MSRRHASIMWQIMMRQLPVLLFLFACASIWLSAFLTDVLRAASLEQARRSGEMVVDVMQAVMMTQDRHPVWDRVSSRLAKGGQSLISVLDKSGRLLFTNDVLRGRTPLSKDDLLCQSCHEDGGAPTENTALFRERSGREYLVFASQLRNVGGCRSCHSDRGDSLGVILVRQSLETVEATVRTTQLSLAALGVTSLVLTLLATHIILRRCLEGPLQRLVVGANHIGRGELDHVIILGEKTELETVATALNTATDRLAKRQQELLEQERLTAIGETVASLVHCLKNHMNGLRAGQYVIDRALRKEDPEKLAKGWRVMKNAVQQLERLTFDMLYDIKERVLEKEPNDPNEVLRDVLGVLEEAASAKGITLSLDLDPDLGTAMFDRTAVYRAILNLASNAIDACVDSVSGDSVILGSRADGDEVVLSVEDNGTGMSAELQPRLFDRFFSTKASQGTGLGLPVVKKVAEEHGGSVSVESTENVGSMFSVRIPRHSHVGRSVQ